MSFSVVGLGEVLWDLLPAGPRLGGAPTNFAYHAGALGARAAVVTRVGNDRLGRETMEQLGKMNLPVDTVQVDPLRPTGTATVTLNEKGVPQYTFANDVAWEQLAVTDSALVAVSSAQGVCFGTLCQRSPIARESIRRLLAAAPAGALRIFDINLRLEFYSRETIEASMRLSNVLKVNDEELAMLTHMFSLEGSVRQRVEWFVRTFGFKVVVITSGALGSLIYQEGHWSQMPPQPVSVVDTVGAGDAFSAALTMGLLSGMDLREVHAIAAEVAGHVCSQPGATPPMPEALRTKFAPIMHPAEKAK
jgi:fructokinase